MGWTKSSKNNDLNEWTKRKGVDVIARYGWYGAM